MRWFNIKHYNLEEELLTAASLAKHMLKHHHYFKVDFW